MNTAEKIATRLTSDLKSRKDAVLPSLGALAQHYDVSYPTMWSAVRILANRGILDISRGRRARVRRTEVNETIDGIEKTGPLERILQVYRSRITQGRLRDGMVFPKLQVIAEENDVSVNTVTKALRNLAHEGLVHKSGKRWIAGPEPRKPPDIRFAPSCVIVLVVHDQISWGGMNQPRSRGFMDTFSSLCADSGVQISPVYWAPRKAPLAVFPAGISGAVEHIRGLGGRYLGTILAGNKRELWKIGDWVRALTPFSRPVVWFDRYGEERGDVPIVGNFFRCRFSESPAVKSVLELLYRYGHRKAGYCALGLEGTEWQLNRGRLLKSLAEEFQGMEVHHEQMFAETWSESRQQIRERMHTVKKRLKYLIPEKSKRLDFTDICSRVENVGSIIQANLEDIREFSSTVKFAKYMARFTRSGLHGRMPEYFRESTYSIIPVLAKYLADPEITAIIAPNDNEAQLLFLGLTMLGLETPKDISFISFDNDPGLRLMPFSTIDFGFDHLGYCAFHLILGDIPIQSDRMGDIQSWAKVVHRGSVSRPNMVRA